MPLPGTVNNELGINAFTGPMGEKEPDYGAEKKAESLKRAAPVASPPGLGSPQRAKRRAVSGGGAVLGGPPAPHASTPQGQMIDHENDQRVFWSAVLSDPEASPLAKQYAEQALGTVG